MTDTPLMKQRRKQAEEWAMQPSVTMRGLEARLIRIERKLIELEKKMKVGKR